ncbi:hypothetical protein MHYMCMPSP_01193 [Hyalomma marginatum]|nr:hypothetical protein MHYMCMPSP_01193 [Hyalomma marginatum]
MKYHSKEQSKVLKLDKLQVISLNAGVGVVISAVKEIIKYFSQDMCTNYELYHGVDKLSNNTLLLFVKHMIDHNHNLSSK